ncbi:hypothetical protein LUZ63_006493 [Rhynchospora breviuscula]|uniref:Uncharacterized protein n=1 Tax=Rhynchospora breviuscula TaxID=2022672 RepID=A0A9Q0CQ55_9POAL|nr:hypothetical protein LUZ63_006493 [Rhynchospora breviuscula]
MSPLLSLWRYKSRRFPFPSRSLFSTSSTPQPVSLSSPTFTIWGANTGVGKTLVSTGLSISVLSSLQSLLYLKPLQTGYPLDSDSRFVFVKALDHLRLANFANSVVASNQILVASESAKELGGCEHAKVELNGGAGEEVRLECKTLYAWREAVGPHLAAEREGLMVEDEVVREVLGRFLGPGSRDKHGSEWRLVETAGGVASPGPTGTLQCDMYRPFRLPGVLVGDGRLGGISSTISAYESLILRGYDVPVVIFEDNGLSNEVALLSYLKKRVPVLVLPPIPKDPSDDLTDWFLESASVFTSLQDELLLFHSRRVERLKDMQKKATNLFWWPFTQHDLVPENTITVIDSRCAESFSIYKVKDGKEAIIPQFDACASWWTQGPDMSLQTELSRDMGYSVSRYGHVMFPENVYEPALNCAELLLDGVGRGWASRVYFSDNGSTAVEIALKMAFRKYVHDHSIVLNSQKGIENATGFNLKVLALNGGYHGDTLGAMEAQSPSAYTGFLQQPWYSGRGIFLEPPTVLFTNGKWELSVPDSLVSEKLNYQTQPSFGILADIFCQTRDSSTIADMYRSYISQRLSQNSLPDQGTCIGALLIEPVIQGAGGMNMIDPLFQRILVSECKKHRIPVIFDEVFTGFWRLGRESAAELLGCYPDIACYAKLMTGGVIPLAATLATEDVFQVFRGNSKLRALLHGHSYSAHALGCTAAAKAVQWFKDSRTNPNLDSNGTQLKELWDWEAISKISSLPNVKRIVAIGTLVAIELEAEGFDTGYASQYATSLIRQLREDGVYMRPLGNVIYLMCGPCTSQDICTHQLDKVYERILALDSEMEEEHELDVSNVSTRQCISVY